MAQDRPGGARTEEPTPRRWQQARERGQIAKSGDLTAAAGFAAGAGALAVAAGALGDRVTAAFRTGIARAAERAAATDQGTVAAEAVLRSALGDLAALAAPVLGAAFVAAAVVGGLQAGGLFTLRPLLPDGRRLDPLAGLGRLFSRRTWFETLKAAVKILAIGAVAYATLAPRAGDLPRLAGASPTRVFTWVGGVALTLVLRVAAVYVVVAVVDYLWQRRSLRRELMMTRDEVKRELRETEGDPRHKAERQRLHRDLLRHQMIEAVRTASCVIVNPDHLAVALKWDEANMGAPQVVAKGERLLAARIKEVARRHGVPIYRDVALARALDRLELGDEIPEELYEAVAAVLRFVAGEAGEEVERR